MLSQTEDTALKIRALSHAFPNQRASLFEYIIRSPERFTQATKRIENYPTAEGIGMLDNFIEQSQMYGRTEQEWTLAIVGKIGKCSRALDARPHCVMCSNSSQL